MGALDEKMIATLPAIRCQTALKAALVLLQRKARIRDLADLIRPVLIEYCKEQLGEDIFGEDSAFGNLDDVPQGNARFREVK